MTSFRLWLTWDLNSRMESSLRSRARIRSVSFGCVLWAKDIAKRICKPLSPVRTCTNQKATLPKLTRLHHLLSAENFLLSAECCGKSYPSFRKDIGQNSRSGIPVHTHPYQRSPTSRITFFVHQPMHG